MAETLWLTQMFPCGSGHKICFRDTNALFKFNISSCYNAGDYPVVNNNCQDIFSRTGLKTESGPCNWIIIIAASFR